MEWSFSHSPTPCHGASLGAFNGQFLCWGDQGSHPYWWFLCSEERTWCTWSAVVTREEPRHLGARVVAKFILPQKHKYHTSAGSDPRTTWSWQWDANVRQEPTTSLRKTNQQALGALGSNTTYEQWQNRRVKDSLVFQTVGQKLQPTFHTAYLSQLYRFCWKHPFPANVQLGKCVENRE